MIKIGGNLTASVQKKTITRNDIGEMVETYTEIAQVLGWLDYASGEKDYETHKAKVEDSSHIFLCDYSRWTVVTDTPDRMVINGKTFDILLVDNPMELCQHMEVYLRYVG